MLSVALDTESVRKASEVAREMHSDAVRCTPGPHRSQTLYPTELWARGEKRVVLTAVSSVNPNPPPQATAARQRVRLGRRGDRGPPRPDPAPGAEPTGLASGAAAN